MADKADEDPVQWALRQCTKSRGKGPLPGRPLRSISHGYQKIPAQKEDGNMPQPLSLQPHTVCIRRFRRCQRIVLRTVSKVINNISEHYRSELKIH
jgi:hypothetical protein